MLTRFWRIYEWLGNAEAFLAKATLSILSALVLLSAVMRTVGSPVGWAQDYAIFLFAWCVFLSADLAMRQDKLVIVDIVTSRLSKQTNYYLKLFNQTLIIAFLAFLVYYSISLAWTSRFVRFQGISYFSYTWVILSVTVGCSLMFVTACVKLRAYYADRVLG